MPGAAVLAGNVGLFPAAFPPAGVLVVLVSATTGSRAGVLLRQTSDTIDEAAVAHHAGVIPTLSGRVGHRGDVVRHETERRP